ncbi:MAG: 30S ribosomal protein S6 [Candidatus Komeilibacteria bacterium RIFCSPLOWO2_01_FULL_53_11]|uniref:Small ribosomal subunit protein bS6 n=1 Tax=Candidatus Komeilibacteria bacterium RIFCSPLOWO2_01_FULL_53_11 TaxID=1798552 RepID=A0A1G2BX04_9BACT|nr:MAG: 30S ribosomal protein S6 [Candidatus Komeilibacteria bacterium RIFCSPLOWO2_01_FULL_53_11]
MQHYELLYLVTTEIPENELQKIQSEISGFITQQGGKIGKDEQLGRRKLAYPIKAERYGFYMLTEFDLEPEQTLALRKTLQLHKYIARHMLVEKHQISAKELLMQEQAKRRVQERMEKQAQRDQAAKEETAAGTKHDQKISLEDLDKKLDEILETDIIQ